MASAAGGDVQDQGHSSSKRLMIREMVLENFKSYAGAQHVGPFHKVRVCVCVCVCVGVAGCWGSVRNAEKLALRGERLSAVLLLLLLPPCSLHCAAARCSRTCSASQRSWAPTAAASPT
jgi:hypothetical protein